MPKSKGGTSLFDLLDPAQEELGSSDAPEEHEGAQKRDAPLSHSGGAVGRSDIEADGSRPSFIALDGQYVRLSLSSMSAAVVLFGLVVALVLAYKAGQGRGYVDGQVAGFAEGEASVVAQVTSEIEATRAQPPNTEAIESLLLDGADVSSAGRVGGDPGDSWIDGYTYVLVQEFAGSASSDADNAQAFLRHHGVETLKLERSYGAIQLITEQGFNHEDDTQRALGERLRDRVREIGRAYYAAGHGYKLEGYFWKYHSDREL